MQYYVSFPGLGIDPFLMNKDAFTLFGLPIRWYGIIISVGMILGFLYALTRAKCEKIKSDDIYDLCLAVIFFGILGARLYYVAFEFDSFLVKGSFFKTLVNIFSIRDGGLAIYGGIIAGFLTVLAVAKVKRIRFSTLLDVVAPAVMIGQIVGRFGNFVNMEAFGAETSLPWRMGILSSFNGGETFFSQMFVHPTFLYESLWNLIGFILVHLFYQKKKFNGQIFFFYISWYGFGRMFIEGLRTDSLMVGPFRVSQLLAGVTFVIGVILMVVNLVNLKRYNEMHNEEVAVESADEFDSETSETEESESIEEQSDVSSATSENEESTEEN